MCAKISKKRIAKLEDRYAKSGSLCFRCRKSVGGLGCCWIDEVPSGSVPVPGWQAAAHEGVQSGRRGIIYTVQACPQFEEG